MWFSGFDGSRSGRLRDCRIGPRTPLDAFSLDRLSRLQRRAPPSTWVTDTLKAEKNGRPSARSASSGISALVITSQRSSPQAAPPGDSYTIWNVSLAKHQAQPLFHAFHPRLLNWTNFVAANMPELGPHLRRLQRLRVAIAVLHHRLLQHQRSRLASAVGARRPDRPDFGGAAPAAASDSGHPFPRSTDC